jgi:hypothetical protein
MYVRPDARCGEVGRTLPKSESFPQAKGRTCLQALRHGLKSLGENFTANPVPPEGGEPAETQNCLTQSPALRSAARIKPYPSWQRVFSSRLFQFVRKLRLATREYLYAARPEIGLPWPLRCSLQFFFGAQPILLGRTFRPTALRPILLRQASDLLARGCGGWRLLLCCRFPFLRSPVRRFSAFGSHSYLLNQSTLNRPSIHPGTYQ